MNLAVHRGIKSRQVEVLDDKNVRRFASYVKIKDDDLEKLRKAKTDGFEARVGGAYLIPLEQRLMPGSGVEYFKSSPKSSIGRLFPHTRLLTDFNDRFDEIPADNNKQLQLWLLYQPLAFNTILGPGLTLNQIRFFQGLDSQLPPSQIRRQWRENPFLFDRKTRRPIKNPAITGALQIHLDLIGEHTNGIVALRARRNSEPIDLRKKRHYDPRDFFEPLKAENLRFTLRPQQHYLLCSNEIVGMPATFNSELGAYSHLGIAGILHRAGFVDNGFKGDLVFEVTSQEQTNIGLDHNTVIGELDIFRTTPPDTIYGDEIGSHYQDQIGPRISKYFKPFDLPHVARNIKKLDKIVLVQDTEILHQHRKTKTGFEVTSSRKTLKLFRDVQDGFFHSRYDCEEDEEVLQVIPYIILFGPDNKVFSYIRSKEIKDFGDTRLFERHSIGVGGHIKKSDGPDYIRTGLERELHEEVTVPGGLTTPKLVGTLFADDEEVDRVHFGLIFASHTDGRVRKKEPSIVYGGMVPIERLQANPNSHRGYKTETWSRVLIPHLQQIYALAK